MNSYVFPKTLQGQMAMVDMLCNHPGCGLSNLIQSRKLPLKSSVFNFATLAEFDRGGQWLQNTLATHLDPAGEYLNLRSSAPASTRDSEDFLFKNNYLSLLVLIVTRTLHYSKVGSVSTYSNN